MLKVHRSDGAANASEFVRAWELADGTRCVLAAAGPSLELRILRDGVILRHARFSAVERALTIAQLWRIECEIGWGPSLLSDSDDSDDEMRH
jgi:hypothetical protein